MGPHSTAWLGWEPCRHPLTPSRAWREQLEAGQPLCPGPSALLCTWSPSELGKTSHLQVWTPGREEPHTLPRLPWQWRRDSCGSSSSTWARTQLAGTAALRQMQAPRSQCHRAIHGDGQRQQPVHRMCPLGGGPVAVLLGQAEAQWRPRRPST